MARIFGPLLTVATITKSTAVCAEFCVELDLTKEDPTEIYVGTETKGNFQPAMMENRPSFCLGCKKRGHVVAACGRNLEREGEHRQVRKTTVVGGLLCWSNVSRSLLVRTS